MYTVCVLSMALKVLQQDSYDCYFYLTSVTFFFNYHFQFDLISALAFSLFSKYHCCKCFVSGGEWKL